MSTAVLIDPKTESDVRAQVKLEEQTEPERPAVTSAWTVLAVSAWIGLVAGGLEGLHRATHQWLTGSMAFMHPGYVWMAPTTLLLTCLVLGVGPAIFATSRRSHRALGVAVTLTSFIAWLNLIQQSLPGLLLVAWILLGCGLATATRRLTAARPALFQRIVWRTLPWLLLAIVFSAVYQSAFSARREAAAIGALPAAPVGAPNVLLIVLDTVRADNVLRDSRLTPNIARFANRGVQFTAAKSTAPWTLPSQAGMFTGRLPHELSSDWWSRLDTAHPTLAEVLSENGWITGGFVGNTRYCSAETGLDRGFTHYEGYRPSWGDFLLTTALGRRMLLSPLPTYFGICDWPARKHADEISDSFLQWMDRHSDRPFFAFLNYWDAHDPYFAAEDFQSQTAPHGKNLMLLRDWWWTHKDDLSEQQVALLQTAYEDCVRGLDHQVGKLLEELESRGVLENTLVVITSDHGEHFGDHDLYLHGNSLYEALLNVPLKIVWPGRIPAGAEVSEPVSLRSLPRTVLDVLGLQSEFPGTPWSEHWSRRQNAAMEKPPARAVVSEIASQAGFPPCHGRSPVAAGPMQCVQFGQWKYIRDALGTEQLFDLQSDPDENCNLAFEDGHRKTVERMRETLRETNPGGALSPWPTIPKLSERD